MKHRKGAHASKYAQIPDHLLSLGSQEFLVILPPHSGNDDKQQTAVKPPSSVCHSLPSLCSLHLSTELDSNID